MATLDGLTLHLSVSQLNAALTGGKIDKVNQPEKDELNIIIRNGGANHRVLICACAESCRVQLTETKKQNPIDAPMFCMLLRKHLTGGRIISITQPGTDRIVKFEIESLDELYSTRRYFLICELMGRHSNIILTNSEGTIIDSIRRIGLSVSQARLVMPNIMYCPPPTEQKKDPLCESIDSINTVLSKSGKISKLLSMAFYGIAPIVAEQIAVECGIPSIYTEELSNMQRQSLANGIYNIFQSVKNGQTTPCTVKCGEKEFFLPFTPQAPNYESIKPYALAGEMLDSYYAEKDKREFMRRRSSSLMHAVEIKIQRAQKRLASFNEAIENEGDYEKYRIYGELISANLYRIRPGQSEAVLENYYEMPPVPVKIKLDCSLSPARNSQKYYKLYKKAKGAKETALKMQESVKADIEYLNAAADFINRATSADDLSQIRKELEASGFIRPEKNSKKQAKQQKSKPDRYVSTDGFEILVGKNNLQNDELTFKIASPFDTWLHVKDKPGSHTVIINKNHEEIPDSTLLQAAQIAAKNSSVGSANVKTEVDYTLCRYVKKPPKALPGKVIYTNQKTILVLPFSGTQN